MRLAELPNWSERPREEQRQLAQPIAGSEKWVLDMPTATGATSFCLERS